MTLSLVYPTRDSALRMTSKLATNPSIASWSERASPWGVPWKEIVERADWYRLFPNDPPFVGTSELEWRTLRKSPGDVPRALRGQARWPQNILTSALARLMTEGPSALRKRRTRVTHSQVSGLVESMEQAAITGEPSDSLRELGTSDALEVLLSSEADVFRDRLMFLATRQTRLRFDRRVQLYAPLYLSNECTNLCTYCGFNVQSQIVRRSLEPTEVRREAETLVAHGHENVLLLTGEAPARFGMDGLIQSIAEIRSRFRSVGIEVFPMAVSGYRTMLEAGIRSVTIYQETYDPVVYRQVHRGGRKRDLLWRLGAPERVLDGGISKVGIGALLGLSDWRYEAHALVLHARTLLERWPGAEVSISFPRLRPADGMSVCPTPVDEEDLLHMMSVLRLLLPEAGLVLSTREAPALRDFLIPRLVTEVSAGVSTVPGGYSTTAAERAGKQFAIADERPLPEVKRRLAVWGFS